MKTARDSLPRLALLLVLIVTLLAPGAQAEPIPAEPIQAEPVQVSVGGYSFPPFVKGPSGGQWSGLTLDLLAAMNTLQSDYQFVFFATSAGRRFRDFDRRHYDMMLFESPHWGWQDKAVDSLAGPLSGREVFIAKAVPGRGQAYFDQRRGKRIVLLSGYHYAFAGFNPDPATLREEYDAVTTASHGSLIQMVLRGRAELGVVSETVLRQYLARYPQHQGQLLVGQTADQHYQHALIMRHGAVPGIAYMEDLFAQLLSQGELSRLRARHGLADSD